MRRLTVSLLLLVLLSSCGVVRLRNSPYYYAGEPVSAGYTPRGIVEEHMYPCSVKGPSQRRMIVYLPSDYYDSEARYPVFYLLHGARGYETAWIRKGEVLQITDSLWTAGVAKKCIVVMPNANQYNDDADYEGSRYKDCFESIFELDGTVEKAFVKDVVDFVDAHFRTIPEKESRAIAGLSAGGLQSLFISANNPSDFGYVGLYSPMCTIIQKPGPDNDFYFHRNKKLADQFNGTEAPLGYYIYVGTTDFFRPHVALYSKYMNRKDYAHEYILTKGGHEWYNWNAYYADMLGKAFKKPGESEPSDPAR